MLCDWQLSIADEGRHHLTRGRTATGADQSGGALTIAGLVVLLLASVLNSVGSTFIFRLTEHNVRMSRAIKRVLIEQAELDRMQQRQRREYLPEMHSMASIYRKSVDILSSKTSALLETATAVRYRSKLKAAKK